MLAIHSTQQGKPMIAVVSTKDDHSGEFGEGSQAPKDDGPHHWVLGKAYVSGKALQ